MLYSLLVYLLFVPWTLFVIATGVPLSFFSPNYLHSYARFWARISLRLAGVQLSVHGQEHLPRQGAVIFMPNHQSNLDILALFAGLPVQFRWLAKKELFSIPLFGFAMRRTDYIPVDRSDRRAAIASMNLAAQKIAGGTSIVLFPEGTRSADGSLLPFKKGGFMLALQAQVPIIPVALQGSHEAMPKHSRLIRPGKITVQIFPAVATEGLSGADRDRLMEQVRQPLAG